MIKKIRGKINNQESKRIISNFLSLIVLRGLDFIIPLITMPYLVKTIGIENFGLVNFALSLALYFGSIIQYGFNLTATREIARNRNDIEKLTKLYNNTFWASIALSIPCVIIYSIIVLCIKKFNDHYELYFSTLALVIAQSLFPIWFFQGTEKMRSITYLSIATKIFLVFSLYLYVHSAEDYWLVPLLNTISAIFSLLISIKVISNKFEISLERPKTADIISTLKSGKDSFISQLTPNLYNNSTTFLLGIYTNNTTIGSFTAATKIIDALSSIGYVISNTFFPYLSRNIDKHNLFKNIIVFAGLFLTMSTIALSNEIVILLYGKDNATVGKYLQALAVCILMIFTMLAYSTNYLVIIGKDKLVKNISLWTSLTFLFVGLLLIPYAGIWGAIITLTGARTVMAAVSYIFYRRNMVGN